MRQIHAHILVGFALALMSVLGPLAKVGQATTFFDDLSAESGGTEAVSGDRWLADTFTTDSASYSSLTATLLLAEASTGSAQLALYADGGYEPGNFIATFTSPSDYDSSLSQTTFTLSGVSLAADTIYWVVLQAPSGEFDWAWTSDFLTTNGWADSPDAGATWFGSDVYPLQYSVVGSTALAGDYNGDGAVDAADYTVWRDSLGTTGSSLAADGDGDGSVDEDDFDLWKSNFGTGSAGAASLEAALAGGAGGAVPEPASVGLVALAFLFAMLGMRRRRV